MPFELGSGPPLDAGSQRAGSNQGKSGRVDGAQNPATLPPGEGQSENRACYLATRSFRLCSPPAVRRRYR